MRYKHNSGEQVDVTPGNPEQHRLEADDAWTRYDPDGVPVPENAAKLPPDELPDATARSGEQREDAAVAKTPESGQRHV